MSDRLSAAMHYLVASVPPAKLGVIKLSKVLWFADCEMFRRHGRTITGEQSYIRMPQGPCASRFNEVIRSLKAAGTISESRVPTYNGHDRRELRTDVDPDEKVFSPEETAILDSVAEEIAKLTAQEASDLSHDDLWMETEPNKAMPVAAGAVRVRSLSEADLDWARAAFA